MPTDARGRLHAGSLGLFDDDFEYQKPSRSAKRQERRRLEGAIRLDEKYDTLYVMQHNDKPTWSSNWLKRLFCGGKTDGYEIISSTPVIDEKTALEKAIGHYTNAGKPLAAGLVVSIEKVDPVDSPWLRECGMVRVRSDDPGRCHIVPRSVVGRII